MNEHKPSLLSVAAAVVCTILLTTGCSILGGSTTAEVPPTTAVSPPAPPSTPVEPPPTTPSTTPAPTWPALFTEARTGVARISTTGCYFTAVGTGFLVDNYHVATAAHVVEEAAGITIGVNGQVVTATIVGVNEDEDVALLRTDAPVDGYQFDFVSQDPSEGTEVGVLGYPQGEGFTTDTGTITGLNRQNTPGFDGVGHIIQTSVTINGGNSGGPLITLDGDVVGVVRSTRAGVVNNGTVQPKVFERTNYVSSGASAAKLVQGWKQSPEPVTFETCNGSAVPTDNRIDITVDTPDERAIQVAQSLLIHAQAINGGAYSVAYNVFTPEAMDQQGGWELWSQDMDTSYWHSITIGDIRSTGNGTITANASFQTTQNAAASQGRMQSCSIWHMKYTMVWASVWWEISKADETMPTERC